MTGAIGKKPRGCIYRYFKILSCCLVVSGLLFAVTLVAGIVLYATFLRFPNAAYLQDEATPIPSRPVLITRDLDGFDSPYLGHSGSWDGKGGGMFGSSKVPDLDREAAMGLRWTFMAVYWRKMEPEGPVYLTGGTPKAWRDLDLFVIAAHERGLNILMQAPVMGGNAGGPPDWAGRRDPKRSAPLKMDAAAAFAGKLVERYRPGGTLAVREGWGDSYGVLAWELDNEPGFYLTNWGPQPGDYAEFVAKVAAQIKDIDPQALILAPSMPGSSSGGLWVEQTLGLHGLVGSSTYIAQGESYSIGPWTDVISFHIYEGLDSFFSKEDRTIDRVALEARQPFLEWQAQQPDSDSRRSYPTWHTEGNFDFLGVTSQESRAAWRFQFFVRGFAAGVAKIMVMDASEKEQVAVRTFIKILPSPFPMLPASSEVEVIEGALQAFRHPDGDEADSGQVWVIWAENGTEGATVDLPVRHDKVQLHRPDGASSSVASVMGKVRLYLPGGEDISPPLLIEDRAPTDDAPS